MELEVILPTAPSHCKNARIATTIRTTVRRHVVKSRVTYSIAEALPVRSIRVRTGTATYKNIRKVPSIFIVIVTYYCD